MVGEENFLFELWDEPFETLMHSLYVVTRALRFLSILGGNKEVCFLLVHKPKGCLQ